MKLIIGLGNPGLQYEQTRHNVGFRVVDALASRHGWRWGRRGRAMLAGGTIGSEKVTLVKPLTYMNNSGEAVGELVRWHKLALEDLLVVHDDLDLAVGQVRLRSNGSAAGHHGMESIIRSLHSNQFPRLRVGIGRPAHPHMETIDYVLGVPAGDERILLATGEARAVETIPLLISQGITATMNLVNADPEAQRRAEERRRQQLERREQERLRREAGERARQEQAQPAPQAQEERQ